MGKILDSKRARELGKKSAEVRRKKAQKRNQERKQHQAAQDLARKDMNILEAMDLWPDFQDTSWDAWKAFLAACFGFSLGTWCPQDDSGPHRACWAVRTCLAGSLGNCWAPRREVPDRRAMCRLFGVLPGL